MAKVLIPTALLQFAGGTDELEIDGNTVQEVVDHLTADYPDLRKHLFNDKGELRHFVNLYKGPEDTRDLQGMATPITAEDELASCPASQAGRARSSIRRRQSRRRPARRSANASSSTIAFAGASRPSRVE